MIQPAREVNEWFSPDGIDKMAQLWARSLITLVDVRLSHIHSGTPLINYRMPTSIQVFISGGMANVQLNHTVYAVDRFAVFHGGKGTKLSIWALDGSIDVFMVLYKAELPAKRSEDVRCLMEQINPFKQQFGCVPSNPIMLKSLFQQMFDHWLLVSPLEQFHAKTLLYQSVREIYNDLRTDRLKLLQPDPVSSTKRYLDEQYVNPVLFEEIAHMFAISRGQLTRLFKRRFGMSLQEYVTLKRLKSASEGLLYTNATIKEVAMSCGMVEELNLIRLFKKYYRMTPSEYRNKKIAAMHDCDIDNHYQHLYNEKGLEDVVEIQGDGDYRMLQQMKSKELIIAATMCLLLLLSGCSSSTPTNLDEAVQANVKGNETTNETTNETRTISTVLGDVEVPTNPQRVVVQYLMGDVVALGINPVGISEVYDGAAFAGLVSEAADLGWMPDWDGEDVMGLQPDLILVIGEEYVDKFSKIAPTVFVPYGEMTVDERITFMGEVLNRQEEAAAVLEEYKTTLETAKFKLIKAGFDQITVSVFEGGSDATMTVFGNKFGAGSVVYASLGLRAPKAVQTAILDKGIYNEVVSFEVLATYSGEFIIRNSYEGMADLSNDMIWNSLKAVQKNQVIEMDFGLNYYTDIYSAMAQINYVSSQLLQRLE
ncbi:AraC family transcriptional regulator [Paenibacillus sp. SYP-B4298]|uniref:AraC family transcriptional regulator n=1 Tax=Paenibacillus sp. SYP-B4298 TaxID=2996034 RepID=UPI0022DE2922|nr:AraC family transcriptional regulator [Paenibacillus sp. SYP-B4298]